MTSKHICESQLTLAVSRRVRAERVPGRLHCLVGREGLAVTKPRFELYYKVAYVVTY